VAKQQRQDQHWLRNSELAAHLGVSVMTVWRWQRNTTLGFPQPSMILGKPYTNVDEVNRWMRERIVDRKKIAA
jgi:predicted DNA-binding transcriptional regulator AlpA